MLTPNMLYKLYFVHNHPKYVRTLVFSTVTVHTSGSFVDSHRYQCSESPKANLMGHSLKMEAPGE